MSNKAKFDTLRSSAFGVITGSYTAIGAAAQFRNRIICITNDTDKGMFFSADGTTDHLFLPAGSFKLFDITANNQMPNIDDSFSLGVGLVMYVKYQAAPTQGAVYIEYVYGS